MTTHYDYIFTGAGCAGLSLLMRLIKSGDLHNKKVLIIDKSSKTANDRTWCFWEKKEGFFESIVYHSWSTLSIYGAGYAGTHDIAPYRYKMIRAIDFYDHCLSPLKSNPNVTILHEEVLQTGNLRESAFASTPSGTYTSTYVFNSIIFNNPQPETTQPETTQPETTQPETTQPETNQPKTNQPESLTTKPLKTQLTTHHSPLTTSPTLTTPPTFTSLLQHFKGFVIRSPIAKFRPDCGTLMDFRVSQQHGTSFVYVLPLSEHEALVEYTLFTGQLLDQETYDQAVDDYIKQYLQISSYDIISSEFGVIPMTDIPFPSHNGRVINIGTAGGKTKPSSGYTFAFIQKQADSIAALLASGKFPVPERSFADKKFHWYDSILLHVLASGKLPGAFVFTELFRKNKIADVFRFLDNESSLIQDLIVIRAMPTWIFAKAAIRQARKPPGSPVLHT